MIRITDKAKYNVLFVLEEKAVLRQEKDKARMNEVFLELDDDADGL